MKLPVVAPLARFRSLALVVLAAQLNCALESPPSERWYELPHTDARQKRFDLGCLDEI